MTRSVPHHSGYDSSTGICWDFHKPGDERRLWRCRCPAHQAAERELIWFGRCRSGQRWFWYAGTYDRPGERYGLIDDEATAMQSAIVAAIALANNRPALAKVSHGGAAHKLKELNAARRAARPPSDATGANAVEYLYDDDGWKYPIVKKTRRRIFYNWHAVKLDGEDAAPLFLRQDRIRFVDRQKIERAGEIWVDDKGRGPGTFLYLQPPQQKTEAAPPDVRALKAAMAAAHPDRGGTNAAFIAARQRYLAALRTSPARQARCGGGER